MRPFYIKNFITKELKKSINGAFETKDQVWTHIIK